MAKKKSTWLSPKKQKLLLEKQRKERNKKIAMIVALCFAVTIAVALMMVGIVMASRPYYASIEIEGYGVITVELKDDEAPNTVDHFVSLAESGFYDGLTISGVLKENMIWGGEASEGNAPATIKGEFSNNGYENNLSHVRGTISLMRDTKASDDTEHEHKDFYDTGASRFFIMQRDNLELDGYYAAFGTVIDGMEIVDRICEEVETIKNTEGAVEKENQPIIKSITIKREK